MKTVLSLSLLALLATGCDDSNRPTTRVIRNAEWDTVWIRTASLEDSVLIGPVGLLLSRAGDRLLVPDRGANQVAAFSTTDGSLQWTLGPEGHGPGEFGSIFGASLLGWDTLAVVDPSNKRVSFVSTEGRVLGGRPLPDGLYGYSTCFLSGGRMLVGALSANETRVFLSDNGEVKEQFPLPWPAIGKLPGIVTQLYLQQLNDSTCVASLMRAYGFALVGARGFSATGKYIEELEFPEVITEGRRVTIPSTTVAARDVSVIEDTIQILFGGNTPDRGALLDLYGSRSLEYLGTYRLPFKAIKLRRRGNLFFALRYRQGLFELLAVRLHSAGKD